jgi:hypothetical protein
MCEKLRQNSLSQLRLELYGFVCLCVLFASLHCSMVRRKRSRLRRNRSALRRGQC